MLKFIAAVAAFDAGEDEVEVLADLWVVLI